MEKALVAITLFLCVTYAFVFVVIARSRLLLLKSSPSEEILRALLVEEGRARRQATLRWGLVLSLVALAFGVLHWLDWTRVTPGSIALVIGAAGIANLTYFALDRRIS